MKRFNADKEFNKSKRKYTKKHLVFSLLGLITLTVLGISFAYFQINDNSVVINSVVDAPINLKIMAGGVEVDDFPEASSDLEYDKTVCTNGSSATWDDSTRDLSISFNGNDDCTAYFIVLTPLLRCLNDYEDRGLTPTEDTHFAYTTTNGNIKITNYKTSGPKDVIIPCEINDNPVTIIDNNAFYNKSLTSAVLPQTLVTIQNSTSSSYGSFSHNQLTSIDIPGSVDTIGAYAFQYNQLTSLTISEGVATINDKAFENNLLTEVSFPNTITYLSGFGRNELTSVTIPDSVLTIGSGAFGINYNLAYLDIGENVITIGNEAFYATLVNNDLTIPSSVESIGTNAFYNSLRGHLTISEGITHIDAAAFSGTYMTGVTLPSTLVSIGNYAFGVEGVQPGYTWGTIGEVVIPDSVTSIGEGAFAGAGVTSLTIGSGVTAIPDYAFNINKLTGEVIVPSGVTSIGERAFSYNLNSNGVDSMFIPNSVKSIGYYAFGNSAIGNFIIENSDSSLNFGTMTIGEEAFSYSRVNSISLGTSLGTISYYSFGLMSYSNPLTIPASVHTIGDYNFESISTINILGKTSESDFTSLGANWDYGLTTINYLG